MSAADLIREVEAERPLAVRLAEAVSLAVLIDPVLLRRARLTLVPEADPGTEADLWASLLVQTRSPDGLVLLPEVAQALRERLAEAPDRLEKAWTLTRELHGHLAPPLRLEEEIAWLSVSPQPDAARRIEELLQSVLAALVVGERRGLAHWAVRALSALPTKVWSLETARLLDAGARLRLHGDARALQEKEMADARSWITPIDLPRVPMRVRLLEGAVELEAGATEGHLIQVPEMDPLLVDLMWEEDGEEATLPVTLRRGEWFTIPILASSVRLRTLLGEVYELRAEGQPGGRLRDWIIDFTEERERHRPFFGREDEQAQVLDRIRETSGGVGRVVFVQGKTGEGKTALLCQVMDRLAATGRLPLHHFFRRGSRWRTEAVERSLRAQLVAQFPALEPLAAHLHFFDLLPRLSLQVLEEEPLVIVLDAVDETAEGEAFLKRFPEPLFTDIVILCSAQREIEDLESLGLVATITLGEPALGPFWDQAFGRLTRRRGAFPRFDELIGGSERNFGVAKVLLKWIESSWWLSRSEVPRSSEDIPPSINLQGLWERTLERLGRESAEAWLGALAAAQGALPSSVLLEILGQEVFNRTRNSPFEPILVTTGEPVHRLVEEVLRDFIASHLDLAPHHRRIAEIATAALEEGSDASEQLVSYALDHAVEHWLAAGDLEGARRLAASARYLIPKYREKGGDAVRQTLRVCIDAFRSVEPPGEEQRASILESVLDILSQSSLPPAGDGTLLLSYLFSGLLERDWPPNVAEAILQIWPEDLPLRPKGFVDKPLRHSPDRRHRGEVTGCLFLENGTTVLSWSTDGTLKLWDAESGEIRATLIGHAAEVTGCASIDDERIVSSSRDGTLRVWNVTDFKEETLLLGHDGEVLGVLMLPDGKRIASWSADRTIRIWSFEETRELLVLRGHESTVTSCALTHNGRYLLSGSADGTVRRWDLSSGILLATWRGRSAPVTAVVTGEGFIISTSLDRTVKGWPIWGTSTIELFTLNGHKLGILGCAVLGKRFATWSYDQTIAIWNFNPSSDWRPPSPPKILQGHIGAVLSCNFLGDDNRLVSGSADGTVWIWDTETGEALKVLQGHAGPVRAIALDLQLILQPRYYRARIISASDDRTLRAWSAEDGREQALLDGGKEALHCVALGDHRWVLTWARLGDLKIYEADGASPSRWIGGMPMAVGGGLVTPDGQRFVFWPQGLIEGQAMVGIWDLDEGREPVLFAGPESPITAGAVTLDGRLLVLGSLDGALSVWDLAERQLIASNQTHFGPVSDIRMVQDGRRAVSVSWDKALHVLDLEKVSSLKLFEGHRDRVLACGVHPEIGAAVSGSADGTLRTWDLQSGLERILSGHDGPVTGCAYTRDGSRIVSCSQDGTLGIWSVQAGVLLNRLRGHTDWINAFVIDDERGVIYSCSEDRTVRAWDLESGEPRGVVYGVSPFRSLALTYDGVAAGDEAGNFWALEDGAAKEDLPKFSYDVFLSHDSLDKPEARELAEALRARGLKVWLEEWVAVPGEPWSAALEDGIQNSRSVVLLIGRSGIGSWQQEEWRMVLSGHSSHRIIPVLLSGASELPPFLRQFSSVDLREGLTEGGIDRLVWGITGKRSRPA